MDSWVGIRIYLFRAPFISKLKGVKLKNLSIDSHLTLAVVGAEFLLQRLAAHNTNSYPPNLDGRTSSSKEANTHFLKWPHFYSLASIGIIDSSLES